MLRALIRFSFRSTGGVANQFSIHLSFSLFSFVYHLCFVRLPDRYQMVYYYCSFSVALAVQGVVKCYIGVFRTRFP